MNMIELWDCSEVPGWGGLSVFPCAGVTLSTLGDIILNCFLRLAVAAGQYQSQNNHQNNAYSHSTNH